MSSGFVLLLTFGIGVVTGLRSGTGPAVVAWAAHLGWINLSGSPLAWMGSTLAVVIFTILPSWRCLNLSPISFPAPPREPPLVGWARELSWACFAVPVSASPEAHRFGWERSSRCLARWQERLAVIALASAW